MKAKNSNEINFRAKAENFINELMEFKNERYKSSKLKNEPLNLTELIIDFCFHKDYEIEEAADILTDHPEFVKILENNAKKFNYLKEEQEENKISEDEW